MAYQPIDNLTYWVQQTLPQVYDDSLSFYEVLSKVMAKLNEVIDASNDYFSEDIEVHVETILQEWYDNGQLGTIINQTLFDSKADKTDVTALQSNKNFTSVKSCGAVGDGVTDDTQAFITCLANNKNVWVPDGTYKLTSRIDIKSGLYLKMSNNAQLKRFHDDVLMSNWDTTSSGYNGQGNIILEGGTLNVNGASYPDVANGLSLAHGQNITIRNLTILDTPEGHAMELTGCKDVLIDRCKFLGYKIDVAQNNYYVEAIQLEPCAIPTDATWTEVYVLDGTDTRDITIQNCKFSNSSTYPSFPCGVGSHGARFNKFYDNVKVINNLFEGHSYWAIRPAKFTNALIQGNTIRSGSGGGIYITTFASGQSIKDMAGVDQYAEVLENFKVLNNTIDTMTGKGIWVIGDVTAYIKKVLIQGNTFKNIGGIGIQTEYTESCKVLGNILWTITGRSIYVNNVNDCGYFSNNILSVQENAFFISNASTCMFADNELNDVKFYGFNVSSGSALWFERNRVKNVSQGGAGAYDHFTIANVVTDVKVINNICRNTGTYLKARYGLNVATGVTGLQRFGNDFKCGALTSNLLDNSTTPITSSVDIV